MRFRTSLVVIGATLLALPSPALGHMQTKADPDGYTGKLAIRSMTFRHLSTGKFKVSSTTMGDWTLDDLIFEEPDERYRNLNSISFYFNSVGPYTKYGRWQDYQIQVDNLGGELTAELYKLHEPWNPPTEREFISEVKVSKVGRTVTVTFAKRKINPRRSYLDWGGMNVYVDHDQCAGNNDYDRCVDQAPYSGFHRHYFD